MALLLVYAAVAGIALVEGAWPALHRIGVRHRLSQVRITLSAFHAATDDDVRQRLILRAGFHTLALSLLLFATLTVACVVMALPLQWIPTDTLTLTAYMVAMTAAAFTWWRLRRRKLRR